MNILTEEESKIFDTVSDFISEKWRKKPEIMDFIKSEGIDISERKWRKFVQIFNRKYQGGLTDLMIAHSHLGYKLTVDYKEANRSAMDNFKRGVTLINEARKTWKSSSERDQLFLDESVFSDEERQIYSVVMGMKNG